MTTPQRIPNYYALGDSVPSWDFVQKYIPAAWTILGDQGSTFLNGWRHYMGGNGINSPLLWRRNGDEVEFSGLIDKAGGNFAGNENLLQLPPEMRIPTSTWAFNIGVQCAGGANVGEGSLYYTVATGVLMFVAGYTNSGLLNPVAFVNLDNLRFPLL